MNASRGNSARSGFTLIELLVVIAIIAVLIALLVPAVQRVRRAANRTESANNMRQLGIGVHAFHDTYKYLPFNGASGSVGNKANKDSGSWAYQILPFVELQSVYDTQNGGLPGTWGQKLVLFTCPIRNRPGFVSGAGGGSGSGGTGGTGTVIPPGGSYTTPAATATTPASGSATGGGFTITWNLTATSGGAGWNSNPAAMQPYGFNGPPYSWFFTNNTGNPLTVTITGGPNPTPGTIAGGGAGPVTDYGINPYINDAVSGGVAAANNKRKLASIPDGSSNTILLGQMYAPASSYNTTTAVPTTLGPFFTGGTLATARTATTSAAFLQDGTQAASNQWGSPFAEGSLFVMGDGAVRLFPYSVTTLASFMQPADGGAVTMPD